MAEMHEATDLVDEMQDLGEQSDEVSVRDMVEALGHRGFGPLIFVPALVVVSPLGGIPGLPSLMALVIVLIAVQILVGRDHFWLPDWIGCRAVSDDKVDKATRKIHAAAEWLDRHVGERLPRFTGKVAQMVGALAVIVLCIMVPPLEFLPFTAVIPMLAIAIIGLAVTVRDGVLMLVGLAAAVAALIGGLYMLISM